MRRTKPLLGFVLLVCLSPACSSASDDTELNIHVAASLSGVFTELGEEFETQFPDVRVTYNFAGSSTLVTQIEQGAPADIVVMADSANINKLIASGNVNATDVADLALNELAILVTEGNPSNITTLSDLARGETRVVLCDEAQPCGRYATTVLATSGVELEPVSREANAAAVVARVANGEADAGIAYLTDGLVADDGVEAVRIPASINVVTNYPIAAVAEPSSGDADAVRAFIDLARGPIGDRILTDAGFSLP